MVDNYTIVMERWGEKFLKEVQFVGVLEGLRFEPLPRSAWTSDGYNGYGITYQHPLGGGPRTWPSGACVYASQFPGCCGIGVISNISPVFGISVRDLLKAGEDILRAQGYTLLLATSTRDQVAFNEALRACGWGHSNAFTNDRTSNHVTVYQKLVDRYGVWWYESIKAGETPKAEGPGPAPTLDGSTGRAPQPVA